MKQESNRILHTDVFPYALVVGIQSLMSFILQIQFQILELSGESVGYLFGGVDDVFDVMFLKER